jgi:GT2 family glycosyltransferase
MTTTLNQANFLFRKERYLDAIELYKRVADEQPSLTKIIEFNIKAASQKLKSPVFADSKSKTWNQIESFVSEVYLDKAKNICLPRSQKPVVSVIIPIYGQIEFTLKCLQSIANNTSKINIEILIIDDCSPDESATVLKKVSGLRLIKNTTNQGFIRSCNLGAQNALGEYLLFLNNDTEVTPDWLEELHRTFLEFPGTGLAGSKLIYPDGRLQEAGGIIWQDGSAWNFGRMQDAKLPVYNYAREVDYCSGASIMVPKNLFDELGGFDEHYLPAYCEDSDLALKIRQKGYRVIYQPLSSVIHYEGITSGTDLNSGVKSYQVDNIKKLYERWKERLNKHQPNGQNVDEAKDRRANKRVLVLDHCTPTPDQDSGSIDAYNQMILFREMDFQVTFIPEDNFLYMPKYTTALQRIGVEALYAPYVTSVEQHVREHGFRYDLVFIARPVAFERQINLIRKYCRRAKVIFHTVDLHFLRMEREADLLNSDDQREKAKKFKEKELSLIEQADVTTVLSEEELRILGGLVPKCKLKLLPYSRSIPGTTKKFEERKDIIFVGGFQHTPNVDAVKYFVSEVMPLIRNKRLGIKFHVVGSNPPQEIKELASSDIVIHGFIESLSPLLDQMKLSVAPLRYGAGIKGKIGTSMAAGLPVIATPLAAEGMNLSDNQNILIAKDSEEYAEKIEKLYFNKQKWSSLSTESIKFASEAWGPNAGLNILKNVLNDVEIKIKQQKFILKLYSESTEMSENKLLEPLGEFSSKIEYDIFTGSKKYQLMMNHINNEIKKINKKEFVIDGYCEPCEKEVPFIVDMKWGGREVDNKWIPNWRERLECPFCRMNNRQRLITTLIKQELSNKFNQKIYLMEQVTPIYDWVKNNFNNHQVIGSEYFGFDYIGGEIINNLRHEDIENLSFKNSELDLIVSNDVLEHVPNPHVALKECYRVLNQNGKLIATIPFHRDQEFSISRSKIQEQILIHILSEEYHGNPISDKGSLVFTDFGWDLIDIMRSLGFINANISIYFSEKYKNLGDGLLILKTF